MDLRKKKCTRWSFFTKPAATSEALPLGLQHELIDRRPINVDFPPASHTWAMAQKCPRIDAKKNEKDDSITEMGAVRLELTKPEGEGFTVPFKSIPQLS